MKEGSERNHRCRQVFTKAKAPFCILRGNGRHNFWNYRNDTPARDRAGRGGPEPPTGPDREPLFLHHNARKEASYVIKK